MGDEHNDLTEREQKEILLALVYAMHFNHGTSGHNGYMTLAKLAIKSGYYFTYDEELYPVLRRDTAELSDGYHTFAELYQHRCLLFVWLMNLQPQAAFKTRNHKDGSAFPGWFVGIIRSTHGDMSYHLPDDLWDMCIVPEMKTYADYDEHSSADVVNRLRLIAKEHQDMFLSRGVHDGDTSS